MYQILLTSPLQRTGRVVVINDHRFFSPNSQRDVEIPPPNPPISGLEDTFWGDRPLLSAFMVPRWLTQEYGLLAFALLQPTFGGDLLRTLQTIPPAVKDSRGRYSLPAATIREWQALENQLEKVIGALQTGDLGHVVCYVPPPSNMGFTRSHVSEHLANRMARLSRDWFVFLMAGVTYMCAAWQREHYYSRLERAGFSQPWIAALEASEILDKNRERVGCFAIYRDPNRAVPTLNTLASWNIPMWYPWTSREEDFQAKRRENGQLPTFFFFPTDEEIANETILRPAPASVSTHTHRSSRYTSLTSNSHRDTTPPMPVRSGTPPPSTPIRVGTPPPRNSGQQPGQTWREFFAARDQLWASKIATESPKERQAREARERQPATKKAAFFEWRQNSCGDWNRHPLTRAEGTDVWEKADEGERRYHAASNTWDMCEDFVSDLPRPTADDYDDDDMEDLNDHERWALNLGPPSCCPPSLSTPAPSSSAMSSSALGPLTSPVSSSAPAPSTTTPSSSTLASSNPALASSIPVSSSPSSTVPSSSASLPSSEPVVHSAVSEVAMDVDEPVVALPATTLVTLPQIPLDEHDERLESPPPSKILYERYGFLTPLHQLHPPVASSSPSELSKMMSILSFPSSFFAGMSQMELDAIVYFIDELHGEGREGGVGIRDREITSSTSSMRGTSSDHSAGPSHRSKKNAKKQAQKHMGSIGKRQENTNPVFVPPSLPQIRGDLWDLDPNSNRNVFLVAKLLTVRKLRFLRGRGTDSRPCYVQILPGDATSWSVGFHSPTDLLHACRMSCDNSFDIASSLLKIGVPFKTLKRLPLNWEQSTPKSSHELRNLPLALETPFRLKNYSFTADDHRVYDRQRQRLFSQRHARAACLLGGVLWRLGKDVLNDQDILVGPSETVTVYGDGVFYIDDSTNELWCDDAVSDDELNLLCGLHCVRTGKYVF